MTTPATDVVVLVMRVIVAIAMNWNVIATINPMMIIGAVFFILNRSNLPQSEIKICFKLFNKLMKYKQLLYPMTIKTY